MQLAYIIGDEASFSLEHRILNVLLILGIGLASISIFINYILDVGTEILVFTVFIDVILVCYYYASIVMKKYWAINSLLIFTFIFIVTPLMWIFNGGLLGASTFYVMLFSSAIALLLNGFKRIAAIGCLIVVILFLVVLEYQYPSLIIGYSNDFTRYVDVFCTLILILATNATAFALAMNYNIKEQQKSREYLVQIEKQKMDNALSRLDRLNLIGEMAASIGHEIRNPLTTVRGYLQFFQIKSMYPHHQEQFETMIEELDRANAIITEFLSLAKNKAVKFEFANLNDSITVLLPLIQADALHRNHEIETVLKEIPTVKFDKKEIRQLLLNLVKNGMEATPSGGKVTIKTEYINGQVVLSVQDTGHGIPEEIMEKLGTPFVTTKDKGTGLGLPVCYRIIERHDAKMEIETSSSGTIFHVKFNP